MALIHEELFVRKVNAVTGAIDQELQMKHVIAAEAQRLPGKVRQPAGTATASCSPSSSWTRRESVSQVSRGVLVLHPVVRSDMHSASTRKGTGTLRNLTHHLAWACMALSGLTILPPLQAAAEPRIQRRKPDSRSSR